MAEVSKMSKGKRKITIEPIQVKSKRQVTFSKRREGLFKKAGELCVVCGAQVAIVTFSNAGKAFCFGHPNTEPVFQRFLIDSNPVVSGEYNDVTFSHYYNNNVVTKFDGVKKEGTNFMMANESMPSGSSNDGFWWDKSVDDLGLAELEMFKGSLEGLRNQLASKLENKTRELKDAEVRSYRTDPVQVRSFENKTRVQDFAFSDHGFTGEVSKLDNEINVGQSSIATSVGDQDFDMGLRDHDIHSLGQSSMSCVSDDDDFLLDMFLADFC